MTETLYIRLSAHANDKVHWLITNDQHEDIIASGDLPNAQALGEISSKAQNRQVVALVSGADVKLHSLNVPGNSQRAIRAAAPFMLEDDLAEDVDELFFAFADKPKKYRGEENCFVAVVNRERIDSWKSWLNDANIFCQVMLPELLSMPQVANANNEDESHWSVVTIEEQLLIRQGPWQGCVVENDWAKVYFEQFAKEQNDNPQGNADNAEDEESETEVNNNSLVVNYYSPLENDDFGAISNVNLVHQPEELPLLLLAKGSKEQKFNLLQGEYQVKKQRSNVASNWLMVASFAVFALLLNLTYKGLQVFELSQQEAQLNEQIVNSYKKAFPKTKRIQPTLVRSRINQKLKEFGSSTNDSSFLAMLEDIRPAFSDNKAIKPETLKFDGKRGEIRLNVAADSYLNFDRFKVSLEQENLDVSSGAQNNQGDEVTGSFTIRYK